MSPPLISAQNIVKRYGAVIANDHVSLDVAEGEIHALLGENGAGKSTLLKVLYGLLQPNEGTLRWKGEVVTLPNPKAARRLGIGMVFQHFSLFDALTVAENIALALDGGEKARDVADRLADVSRAYGLPLEPSREVWRLSVGERQRIEIVRCLMQNPQLVILDEPTSVLTPQETDGLFATLRQIKAEGRAILYISHKLEEVRSLCERATILRHGKVVATCDPRSETAASLARMMVGVDIGATARATPDLASAPVRLAIRDLSMPAHDLHGVSLKRIRLAVRAGEIVGIAGVAGNGQDELFAALSGERLVAPDAIAIDGEAMGAMGITARRRAGAAFVPEERLGHAAAPTFSLSDNAIVSGHAINRFVRGGLIDRSAARGWVERVVAAFDVRKGPPDPPARALSGGNLQKFVVGREMLRKPGVLVVAQPTWGVDAGAATLIRGALLNLAREGSAILVISQDLDELFELCDRIAVIFQGRLSPAKAREGLTREDVGLLMGGAAQNRRAA